ncbi:MAG: PspA/IM30 family protein [Thomasclavelia sp.]
MGILTRFTDIMKSNINALLDKCEDPAKMIDQTLRDLREDLAEVKKKQPTLLLMQKVQIVKFKNVKMKLLNTQQLLKML